ncbi:MAG: hypothetical protein IJ997_03705 [Mycoplasmataceae bacterium]|nr:hypothetical protein [Mycoplasmataceae bacterium]
MKIRKSILLPIIGSFLLTPVLLVSCSNSKKTNTNDKVEEDQFGENDKVEVVLPSKHDDTLFVDNSTFEKETLLFNNNSIPKEWTKIDFEARVNSTIKKFVLDNLKTFLKGDLSKIQNESDLEAKFIDNPNDPNSIYISISILENKWYKNNEVQTTKLEQQFLISNFAPIPETLNSEGGTLDEGKLKVSHYLSTIKLFNFNYLTNLSKLNDDYFNNILVQIEDFKNLKIEIKEGNTKEGKLILELSGTYKGQEISAQNIEITGFKIIESQYVQISNIVLNKDQWFESLLPIINDDLNYSKEEINKISSQDWIEKYFLDFKVYDENDKLLFDKNDLLKMGFSIVAEASVTDKKELNFSKFDIQYKNKKYNSNSKTWDEETPLELKYLYKENKINLPNENDVKKFLISKSEINLEVLKTKYPSYFLSQVYWSKTKGKTYSSIDSELFKNEWLDRIKSKYLKNKEIAFGINVNGIYANDFKNTLDFVLNLVIDDELDSLNSKEFNFNNQNKNINENEKIKESLINEIYIDSNEENSIFKNLKKVLKEKHKDVVDSVFNTSQKQVINNLSTSSFIMQSLKNNNLVFDGSNSDTLSKKYDQIQKHLKERIFNQDFSLSFQDSLEFEKDNTMNVYSKLFSLNKNERFLVESIYYYFPDKVDIELIKIDETKISVNFNISTIVSFASNESKEYKTKVSFILLKNSF